MIRVDSTSIESVGYDGLSRNLYVKFTSGKFYTYCNVPRNLYIGLIGAKSTGQCFTKHVKGTYETDGLEEGPK